MPLFADSGVNLVWAVCCNRSGSGLEPAFSLCSGPAVLLLPEGTRVLPPLPSHFLTVKGPDGPPRWLHLPEGMQELPRVSSRTLTVQGPHNSCCWLWLEAHKCCPEHQPVCFMCRAWALCTEPGSPAA